MKVRVRSMLVLVMVLSLFMVNLSLASAHDPGEANPPTQGLGPTVDESEGEGKYSGPTEERHDAECTPTKNRECPNHGSTVPHVHVVDAITNKYNGFYDINTGRGCVGPCTLSTTETQSWSHKFGVTIDFSAGPISGKVGYDVTYSSSQSFSYQFPVAAGETKVIWQRDWYHVTNMNVHTDWIASYPIKPTYGTAWAGQWYSRIFRAEPFN